MTRIFISSVQSEFAEERLLLKSYIENNPVLRRFFNVFVFEQDVPPTDKRTDEVYLNALAESGVYVALIGERYCGGTETDISPTEREYDEAARLGIPRIVLVDGASGDRREPRERKFLDKISTDVTWHIYGSTTELLNWVLAALDRILDSQDVYHALPFEEMECRNATMKQIDEGKVRWFLRKARFERHFAMGEESRIEDVLYHLHLLNETTRQPTNAAILLFGKDPQGPMPSSLIKCAHWHGTEAIKPILSHQEYVGNLFDLVDQSTEFVLARIDRAVGTRQNGPDVPRTFEIPKDVIFEAIVNAVVHRDYASTASVQVELYSDRLTVSSPGTIHPALTPEKLRVRHRSYPNNPRIAEPFYQTRYIDRIGSGITDLIDDCRKAGLRDPEYEITPYEVVLTIWRPLVEDGVGKSKKHEQVAKNSGQHAKKNHEVAKNGEQVAKNEDASEKKLNCQAIENYLISEGVRRDMRSNMLAVMTEISKDEFVTIETLMGLTSLSFGGVRNALSGLKLHRLLRREGGDRGGHWVLLPLPKGEGDRS